MNYASAYELVMAGFVRHHRRKPTQMEARMLMKCLKSRQFHQHLEQVTAAHPGAEYVVTFDGEFLSITPTDEQAFSA